MTDFETVMWRLDADPRLSSTIANITLLDRPPDWQRLRGRLDRASMLIPRLRQRVVTTPGDVVPPRWAPDPAFDLDHHVRRTRLRGRRSRRATLDLAMELFSEPFDRTRPLWDFVVIEGLADGRAAMLQRLHHALTDGIGGLRISEQFIDLERDAPEPPPIASPPPDTDAASDTTPWAQWGDAVSYLTRQQVDALRRRGGDALAALTHPHELIQRGAHGLDVVRSTARQARLDEHRLSPLWQQRSLDRRLDLLDVPLAAVKDAARALGGSVNDVFVTGALIAAGEYHRRSGMDADELRVAMPISTRGADRSAGGNLFAPTQTVLPTSADSPTALFAEVKARLGRTRAEPALGAVEALAGSLRLLPNPLLVWAGYRTSSSVDFVTSNIRAAPFDLYLAGALMEGNYPIGPLAGAAFNLTTMSYRGNLNMGLVTDTAAVGEPELLAKCLDRAYRRLIDAAAP